ncbi:MAG TPA: lipid A deacylase LpxR family protein [Kangiella sp.]|uniref:lipid A deacylase LpxR family protein n=1 Tax=Kangiella sp. TaxID=1920245 RepID=UPI002F92CB4E
MSANTMQTAVAMLALCFSPLSIAAGEAPFAEQELEEPDTFVTITVENDLFAGRDGGYTNGFGVSWGSGPYKTLDGTKSPEWLQAMGKTFVVHDDKEHFYGASYSIFQGIQTPSDITNPNVQPDDLPYAGILGWRGTVHSWTESRAEQFSLLLGVVGPASLAEQSQKTVHKITGSDKPMGWDYQLHNEPVFALQARRSWRYEIRNGDGHGIDFIGMLEASGGNFSSYVAGTYMVRWGLNLERSHAAISVLPGRGINPLAGTNSEEYYVFFGVQPRYVFNDVFVNGNTFRNSPSVTLKNEQLIYSTGFVWNWKNWGLLFSLAETTSTFEERKGNAKFGSVSISYRL